MNASLPAKTRPRDFWQTLDTVLMCVLIVAMCSQINLLTIGRDTLATEGYSSRQFFLALSDVIFVVAFFWFCVRTTVLRAWRKVWVPPLPCFALLFVLFLSVLHSTHVIDAISAAFAEQKSLLAGLKSLKEVKELKVGLIEIAQFAAAFLAVPLLFVNLLRDRRVQLASTREYSQASVIDRTRVATVTFCGITSFVFICAILPSKDLPRSSWGSPNIFSVFVAVAGAFLACLLVWISRQIFSARAKEKIASPEMQFIFLLGFFSLTFGLRYVSSIWALAALSFGAFMGISLLRAGKIYVVAALICIWSASALSFSPSGKALTSSFHASTPTQKVKKQYIEWYSALGWSRLSLKQFATGVGPDNYQFNIGSYYGGLPNEEKMPPDSNNLYLVQMVSLGALGLGALLWVFVHFTKIAWRAARKRLASARGDASNANNALGAATFAALVAFLFVNVFHAGLVRGMSFVLAFLFSLAVVAWQASQNQEIEEITNEQ